MKILFQIILMSLTMVGVSCDDDADQGTEGEAFVQSVDVPDTVTLGVGFTMEFVISLSGCWTYARLEKEEAGSSNTFRVFAKNPSAGDASVACPTGLFTETIQEQVTLNTPGSNDLIFNDNTLQKTIFVTN